MLLLLFSGAGAGPVAAPSGHPGYSRNRRYGLAVASNDDDAALQMLLDAEDRDVLSALEAYDTALRRLL